MKAMDESATAGTPRNIALIGPYAPYRGGIAHFGETLRRGLEARGHTVTPVTFSRQYPQLLFPGKTQLAPDADTTDAERLLDTCWPPSWWRTARHVADGRPDAALFQYWMPFFAPAYGAVARLLRRRGIPSLAVVHNAEPHERFPLGRPFTHFFLKACAGHLALSEAVEDDLRALGVGGSEEAPIQQAAHPVYDRFGTAPSKVEARAALGLPEDAPVLLFFGFVREYKGLDVLLDAMPRVLEKLPEAHLLVAGEFYDDPAPYRAQIRRHGLEGRVHVHDQYLPDDEVPVHFAAADAVVQPYRTATQSGVAQIAFHFDRPVITTDVGGLSESIPHERAGLVVPPEQPAALADAVARFFREEGLADRLTQGVTRLKEERTDGLYDALEDLLVVARR